jgi:PAS domain-containing protein
MDEFCHFNRSSVELQGVGHDISERKQLERKLAASEHEFSTLVENSPDVICRFEPRSPLYIRQSKVERRLRYCV